MPLDMTEGVVLDLDSEQDSKERLVFVRVCVSVCFRDVSDGESDRCGSAYARLTLILRCCRSSNLSANCELQITGYVDTRKRKGQKRRTNSLNSVPVSALAGSL